MLINTVVTLSARLMQSAASQLGCTAKLVWKKNKKENNDKSNNETSLPIAERHQISEALLDVVKIKAYKRPLLLRDDALMPFFGDDTLPLSFFFSLSKPRAVEVTCCQAAKVTTGAPVSTSSIYTTLPGTAVCAFLPSCVFVCVCV